MTSIRILNLACFVIGLHVPILAQDTTGPSLVALSFAPNSIDTTGGPTNVAVQFSLTDDLSGARFFQAVFGSPSGMTIVLATSDFSPALTYTGTATATFPQFIPSGTWNLVKVQMIDAVGNNTILGQSDLAASGFPTVLTVTSTEDVTGPTLTGLGLTPTSIDASNGPATATVSFSVTDDLSGARFFQAVFQSPSDPSLNQVATSDFSPALSHTGTATVTFPQFSPSGTWNLVTVQMIDAVGNNTVLRQSDLAALGFSTGLTVFSTQDVTGPTLTGLGLTPTSIDASNGPATVTVNFSVTDDLSGARFFQAVFQSPSDPSLNQVATSDFSPALSHTGTATATFPQFSPSGTWNLVTVQMIDAVGNNTVLRQSDLARLGFSATVQVIGDSTPPTIVPIIDGTTGNNGWYKGPVSVNWTISDPESGISFSSGCTNTTLTNDSVNTLQCSATNGAGLTNSVAVTIKIDQTPPTISCTAAPTTLWPPNGESVPVTVVGITTDATSGVDPSGITYAVTDEYGQVQPSGSVRLGDSGSYSFVISLIAEREDSDQDGRMYTIVVRGKDRAGNAGSCSTAVTVPHDQRK